ncbi:MAG TPA: hypothetical protein VED40_10570 [Azospirillaceae bacterium]|nr:hypothetical protein [Azospirillaceae bacterium]
MPQRLMLAVNLIRDAATTAPADLAPDLRRAAETVKALAERMAAAKGQALDLPRYNIALADKLLLIARGLDSEELGRAERA